MTSKEHHETTDQPGYSTKKIEAFAMGDEASLRLILDSFVQSTWVNLNQFRKHLAEEQHEPIIELAHKMRSMFLQLEATGVARLLNELEENQLSSDAWKAKAQETLNRAEDLVKTIQTDYRLD
ncbi:Hpt domain-containing protein [uncultured Sunxiuqinia sp.]|uniref:Hpt domain-containing protein n=1 Tax=uncultured Sunxiuqinia sp. TaxID=1573825 RepID=UPI0019CF0800|nr:hypothetical protein [Sunxiuqinia sp.]